ncbi:MULTISPECIES: hypothetical protein [unclassified Microbulbifer]|uniref:hypothetical protein n=1 Tax=unclassified Microbulbifer TaxID=2619833 RepID=UPI0027E3CD7E|nr:MULTISPECIES: hypothetical protein [unclassified Microbulbifer]
MKHILTILSILLSACAAAPASQDRQPIHYDTGSSSDEDDHTYSIETDSEETISLKIRISNAAGDTLCDKGHIYTQDTISATDPAKRNFSFSRKGSPNIALYEWHLCFIKDGVVYRGWRGFDPGPNTVLKVKLYFDRAAICQKYR